MGQPGQVKAGGHHDSVYGVFFNSVCGLQANGIQEDGSNSRQIHHPSNNEATALIFSNR